MKKFLIFIFILIITFTIFPFFVAQAQTVEEACFQIYPDYQNCVDNLSSEDIINNTQSTGNARSSCAQDCPFIGPDGQADCGTDASWDNSVGTCVLDEVVVVGNNQSGSGTGQNTSEISGDQLVPCTGEDGDPCEFNDFILLVKNTINFLIKIAIPIATILFAYSGFLYVTAAGKPSQIEKAHNIFRDVFIGFLIVVSAWLVVNTIISPLLNTEGGFTSGLESIN